MTISLLKRSYRYALLDLGHQLAPLIKHNGYYSPEKRIHTDPNEPIPELVIPKYAQNMEILVRFYTDPVHRADHHDVREPHLPGHIVPPKPLLSTVRTVFNRTDKSFINLYRDALKAYDDDQLLGDTEIRQRWQQRLDDSWDWIIQDPATTTETRAIYMITSTEFLAARGSKVRKRPEQNVRRWSIRGWRIWVYS